MAFKKTLVQRLFNLSRFSTPRNAVTKPPDHPQRRPLYHSTPSNVTPSITLFPLNIDGVMAREGHVREEVGLTVSEVRRVLRGSLTELIKGKLMEVGKDWVSYKEFLGIIEENCGQNKDEIFKFAKMMDDCGVVIVLGNSVCLRPMKVAKVIQGLVKPPMLDPTDPRRQELDLLENQKVEIDQKAEALVRRELWAGLGFIMAQTAAFMRLTFWELSWDVMEPICFYVTSAYFILGYTFFLRTSKEPSFEGFFQSRFCSKQKRLIKNRDFDIERYNELKKIFTLRI